MPHLDKAGDPLPPEQKLELCRVGIVAEDGLAGRHVALDDALDSFAQKCLTEIRVTLHPRADGLLKVVG